jgi:hypothetical protein
MISRFAVAFTESGSTEFASAVALESGDAATTLASPRIIAR